VAEPAEVEKALSLASNPAFYSETYGGDIAAGNPLWQTIPQASGEIYPWDDGSSYIKEPPFLDAELRHTVLTNLSGARALAILGNSVTTDHITDRQHQGLVAGRLYFAIMASRSSISTITARAG